MNESRMELLSWLNATLDLNYTKVEQLGSGAAYCQLMDSIYLDVAMHKVKYDSTKEYEFMNNYKVLQASFIKHKVNKTIPVERLVKCRFQDNLEFFQWIRKFWKENKDESEYDPNARRKWVPPTSTTSNVPSASTATSTSAPSQRSSRVSSSTGASSASASIRRTPSASASSSTTTTALSNSLPRTRTSSAPSLPPSRTTTSRVSSINSNPNKELERELLQTKESLALADAELDEYRTGLEALETERNFYFNKLREIEILVETTSELLKETSDQEEGTHHQQPSLKEILVKIQDVLYSTEEGFQIPDESMDMEGDTQPEINMEETF